MFGKYDPQELLDMPSDVFCQWIAYLQVKDGSFKSRGDILDEQVNSIEKMFGG